MITFGQIESDIFVGSAPQSSVDVARLKQAGITAVISLQSDEDFRTHGIDWKKIQNAYQYSDILIERFPIRDFDEIDMGEKLAPSVVCLDKLLKVGHRLYVHCNAGVCRAPAAVLGYLCHFRGMDVDQGLNYIRKNRPQANPYLGAVKKALMELEQRTWSEA